MDIWLNFIISIHPWRKVYCQSNQAKSCDILWKWIGKIVLKETDGEGFQIKHNLYIWIAMRKIVTQNHILYDSKLAN